MEEHQKNPQICHSLFTRLKNDYTQPLTGKFWKLPFDSEFMSPLK